MAHTNALVSKTTVFDTRPLGVSDLLSPHHAAVGDDADPDYGERSPS
jgi:hypothetical protein